MYSVNELGSFVPWGCGKEVGWNAMVGQDFDRVYSQNNYLDSWRQSKLLPDFSNSPVRDELCPDFQYGSVQNNKLPKSQYSMVDSCQQTDVAAVNSADKVPRVSQDIAVQTDIHEEQVPELDDRGLISCKSLIRYLDNKLKELSVRQELQIAGVMHKISERLDKLDSLDRQALDVSPLREDRKFSKSTVEKVLDRASQSGEDKTSTPPVNLPPLPVGFFQSWSKKWHRWFVLSQDGSQACFVCYAVDHLVKDCPSRNRPK